jgi:hypothetical protein
VNVQTIPPKMYKKKYCMVRSQYFFI